MALNRPSISLCMIVRDEEDWLEQCVLSAGPIVDQVVVVDTGSTDSTLAIARRLGAEIYEMKWEDDFSAPRNFSLEKATGDWILVLDADETIASRDLSRVQRLCANPSYCYEITQRHYTNDHRLSFFRPCSGEYPEWEADHGGFFESGLVRLFPRHPGIYYKGRVHELVEHSIRDLDTHRILKAPFPIHHFGHTEKVNKKKDKSRIYAPLGETKRIEDATNWQAHFEMGVEHNRCGRYEDSVDAFMRSLALHPKYVPTWVNMGYVQCEMGRFTDAIMSLTTALELEADCHEAYCNLGVVYLRTADYARAERCLSRAIEIDPLYVNAYCNLGKALAYLKRHAEAANIYLRALKLLPRCSGAKADLGALYLSARQFELAERYLAGALEDEPSMSRAYFHLGQTYKLTGCFPKAIGAFERFLALEKSTAAPSPDLLPLVQQVEAECRGMRKKLQTTEEGGCEFASRSS